MTPLAAALGLGTEEAASHRTQFAVRTVEPGLVWLLGAKLRGRVNRARTDPARVAKALVFGGVAAFFWSFIFAVIFRMLLYFRGTQGVGDLLAGKLLALALLTFMSILLLSNVIAALSTFFLARDLELLMAAPLDPLRVYGARLTETAVNSSWMVALLAVPLFAAYGVAYDGGPLFVLLAVAVLVGLLVIPSVVGSAVTLLLVNVFPARRTRDLLALIGLFTAAGVVALFRFLRPERLVRPDEFRDLVDFLAVLRAPTSPWLPSEWAADAILSFLRGGFDPLPLLLLLSTAAAFVVMGAWLHGRYYRSGYTRAQEGAEQRSGRERSRRLETWLRPLDLSTRQLIAKEVRVFFRDATQWSQLILLGVLVVVYVYNIRSLPLYTGEQLSFFLINLVSFLNLGLAGFVVAAVAARFIFPAMSLEGRMLWLLRSAPIDLRRVFWSKYWVGLLPLLAIALPLIVGTNLILEASPFLHVLSALTMVGVAVAMTAMALGFGALHPNFETENAAEIPTSFGGLLFMMTAVAYLAALVLLEAWPVYLFLESRLDGGAQSVWPLVLGLSGALVLTVAATVLPLRAGVRKIREIEV